jgi:hypothetical protein
MEAKLYKLCDLLDEVSRWCLIISFSVVPLMVLYANILGL